jgi:large subunit ribosomal protein L6
MQRTTIELPDDVSAEVDHFDLTVEGPNGSVSRRLWYPNVSVTVDDGEIAIERPDDADRETEATVGTFESHVENIIHGVTEGWEYEMEVFYAHFPMDVSVDGDDVVVDNYLGERAPRRASIMGDTRVEVDGEEITLSGPSKEDVGQTAANIEQLTSVTGKDTRIFQDGVYITKKPRGGA